MGAAQDLLLVGANDLFDLPFEVLLAADGRRGQKLGLCSLDDQFG